MASYSGVRWLMGWMEERRWAMDQDVFHSDDNSDTVTSAVHDRMPVILRPDDNDLWLDPGMQYVPAIFELLKPYDARLMRCYPVSTQINNVANDDAECSRHVKLAEAQERLFL
jgi:SOS response associated peptidase (SRAP)